MNATRQPWHQYIYMYMIGFYVGSGIMVVVMYMGQATCPSSRSIVTVSQDGTQAKTNEVRQLQRVKELRFSLEKLERLKAVQDAFLKQAVVNQDDIRGMVAKLGEVGK